MATEGEGEEEGEGNADSQFSRADQSSLFPFSENNIPGNNKTEFQLQLPVKYAVYVVVTRYWLLGLSVLPSPLGWTWRIEYLCARVCARVPVSESEDMCAHVCVCTCMCTCVCEGPKLAHAGGPTRTAPAHHPARTPSGLRYPHACSHLYTLSPRPPPRTPLMFCHLLPLLLSPISLEVSTKYLNFTASEKTRHIIEHQYQVGG